MTGAAWTPEQWAQIAHLARMERQSRAQAVDPFIKGTRQQKAALQAANRCARNVRRWAEIAGLMA